MIDAKLPAIVLALFAAAPAYAASTQAAWLRDHADLEVNGGGGWRTSLGGDVRAPGFQVLAGGGEMLVGLDVAFGLGIVASGRVVAGSGGGYQYFEGSGAAALQVRVSSRVRLRVGAAAGQVTYGEDSATLVGGVLAGSFDLFSLGGGRLATALNARLDIDSNLGARVRLPDQSLALAVGLGFRY